MAVLLQPMKLLITIEVTMTDFTSVTINFVTVGFIAVLIIVGLVAWFYVNRASVRATEQIRLLEALLYEQKKQKLLLRQLADALNDRREKSSGSGQDMKNNDNFSRLIPER